MIPLVIKNKWVLDSQTKGKAACAGPAKMMLSKEQASCRLLTAMMLREVQGYEWCQGMACRPVQVWAHSVVREDAESGHVWH